jgi:hypothetical protein
MGYPREETVFFILHSVAGTGCIEKGLVLHLDPNQIGTDPRLSSLNSERSPVEELKKMNDRFYQLKIRRLDIEPAIWTRFVMPADITRVRLHDVF